MGPRGHRARCRRSIGPGRWEVRARIERFVEPALLQLLSEQPMHGYELLERLPELAREERRVDLGNLYRLLRSLEEEGIVSSDWDESVSGPAKRIYRLTPAGRGPAGPVGRRPRATRARWSTRSSPVTTHGKGVNT